MLFNIIGFIDFVNKFDINIKNNILSIENVRKEVDLWISKKMVYFLRNLKNSWVSINL